MLQVPSEIVVVIGIVTREAREKWGKDGSAPLVFGTYRTTDSCVDDGKRDVHIGGRECVTLYAVYQTTMYLIITAKNRVPERYAQHSIRCQLA